MTTKFLFMDEKYADPKAPRSTQVISLTGVLIPANSHRVFRGRFYRLVSKAIGDPVHVISTWPHEQIHASKLLPDSSDNEHFVFLEGLVSLVNELEFRIYRIGYYKTRQLVSVHGGEKGIVGLCFFSMLSVLKDEVAQVWPVMEIDCSWKEQDQAFAGLMQSSDYMGVHLGREGDWPYNANFGEVLYMTKRSGYGALVDCVAYLLHAKWVRSEGHDQTLYKKRLANIASGLTSAVAFDRVTEMKVKSPQAK